MNENCCPVNIYLYLSTAFHSLNYDILLSKLAYYGLQQSALLLLTSFLQDRCQYFNILINDGTHASTKFDFIMYADDTTLASTLETLVSVNDIANLEREWNQEITKVYSWILFVIIQHLFSALFTN